MANDLIVGLTYSHNKRPGHLYKVIGTATNCTNAQEGEILVIYKRINTRDPQVAKMTFAREVVEFMSRFSPYTED